MAYRTKDNIKHSLLRLLNHKNIDDITVIDICKAAQIGRRTFYLHYDDKFDLLDKIVDDYTEHFLEIVNQQKEINFKTGITKGFEFINAHKFFFSVLFKSTLSQWFMRKTGAVVKKGIEDNISYTYLKERSVSKETIVTFLNAAVLGVVADFTVNSNGNYFQIAEEINEIVSPFLKKEFNQ